MTQLTEAQRTVLTAATEDTAGLVVEGGVDRRVVSALIKRGLCISIPKADGPSRLVVTEAGKAALSAEPGPTEPSEKNTPPEPALEPNAAAKTTPSGKLGALVALLRRPQGASLSELVEATGWQTHSVRGAMSGSLKKKLGLNITSEKTDAGRVYRIAAEAAQ